MYPVKQFLIPAGDRNRPGTRLHPKGIIIHSTALDDVPDENISLYFAKNPTCKTSNIASAHYALDWDSITEMIPENEVAYHAGPMANYKYLSIEICETNDPVRFEEAWKRATWLAADICKRYQWNPDDKIRSHNWVTQTLGGTDHTDPYPFFVQFGKDMDCFIADVKTLMQEKVSETKMKPQDSEKVAGILSQQWLILNQFPGTEQAKAELERLADEVRIAGGLPPKNR